MSRSFIAASDEDSDDSKDDNRSSSPSNNILDFELKPMVSLQH